MKDILVRQNAFEVFHLEQVYYGQMNWWVCSSYSDRLVHWTNWLMTYRLAMQIKPGAFSATVGYQFLWVEDVLGAMIPAAEHDSEMYL